MKITAVLFALALASPAVAQCPPDTVPDSFEEAWLWANETGSLSLHGPREFGGPGYTAILRAPISEDDELTVVSRENPSAKAALINALTRTRELLALIHGTCGEGK